MEITEEDAKKELYNLMTTPDNLQAIQPCDNQFWNCDEVGFDPNGKWYKVVCTYKWCNCSKIWKLQTNKRAPFWVTMLVFTRPDGQVSFAPPIIVH